MTSKTVRITLSAAGQVGPATFGRLRSGESSLIVDFRVDMELTWRLQQSGFQLAQAGSLRNVLCTYTQTHTSWPDVSQESHSCMYVYVSQRIVCVSFLNNYRCMLQLAFGSSVMVLIVSLRVGDSSGAEAQMNERSTRWTHADASISLQHLGSYRSQTFPYITEQIQY